MKRWLWGITFTILAAAALLITVTYPAIGGVAYRSALLLETALYGLKPVTVSAGDTTLPVLVGGPDDAPHTLILLHGYSADKDLWVRFARYFTADTRVIIPDLAGHGAHAFDPALKYSTTAQAQRVLALMDSLGVARAHVIGNSMGGFIAARLAHDYPERVASAVLIDAAGVASPKPSTMDALLAAGDNPFLFEDRAGFRRFYPMTMAQAPWVPGITLDWMADRYIARRPELTRIFQDFYRQGMLDAQLSDISAPTLVLWGAQDQLLSVSMADVWCRGIPTCQAVIYDDLGHMPMVEDPARTADEVRRFLATLPLAETGAQQQ